MRAAGCFAIDGVYYTGDRYDRAAKFHTDTKNFRREIPLTHVDNLVNPEIVLDASVIAIELTEGAIPLPEFVHPTAAFYILGPEDGTINQSIIDQCESVVYVPTQSSLNLAVTANIILYDRLCKSSYSHDGDQLIRQSRDTNNATRWKNPTSS